MVIHILIKIILLHADIGILIYNDASIKHKDVKTNNSGEYSTTDNIYILNIVSLSGTDAFNLFNLYIFYAIHYKEKSNTTTVTCYNITSYVDHKSLNNYLDNRSDDISILACQHAQSTSIDIRLYYI